MNPFDITNPISIYNTADDNTNTTQQQTVQKDNQTQDSGSGTDVLIGFSIMIAGAIIFILIWNLFERMFTR